MSSKHQLPTRLESCLANMLDIQHFDNATLGPLPVFRKGQDAQVEMARLFEGVKTRAQPTSQLIINKHAEINQLHLGLEERLFSSRSEFKVYASSVSMHLGREWLTKLFSQVDSALDAEEWDPRDPPPRLATAKTFIRMLLLLQVKTKPGLGVSNSGNFVAAWTNEQNRLTVECFPEDKVRWVLSRVSDSDIERAAGEGRIERLKDFIAPYKPEIWFDNAKQLSPR